MTGPAMDERLRRTGPWIAGLCLALAGVTGCTSGGQGAASGETKATATVPNQVPDDTVAVTDEPRPDETDVVLSFVGWEDSTDAVEAAGYVSPVVETGGTCTLELERDGRRVAVTAPAEADATTTVCGDLRAPRDELASGVWTAVLHYRSPTSQGSSEPMTVEVPQ